MEGNEAAVFRCLYSTEERKKTRIVLLAGRARGSRLFSNAITQSYDLLIVLQNKL